MRGVGYITAGLVCTLVGSLSGQAPAKAPSEKEKAEKELVDLLNLRIISVSKVAQRPIEAPGLVSGISQEQVREYGWLSLNEVMTALPGFSPSQDYDRRTVSARGAFEGWNNNHVLLLVDGLPMNDNIYGTAFTWEATPLFMAKNLEILRGPGSALYGSNAMNGVASINTYRADDLEAGGQTRVRFGERASRSLDFVTGGTGGLFTFVVAYSNLGTRGHDYPSFDGSGATGADGRLAAFKIRDRRDNDYFFGKLEGLYDLDGLSLQFHQQRWSFETGHGWLFLIPDLGEAMNEQRQILALRYLRESGSWTQEYALRYQVHRLDWNTRYAPDGSNLFGIDYPAGLTEYLKTSADEWFARAQGTFQFGRSGNLVFGLEAVRFGYTGDLAHFANADLNFGGSYLPNPEGAATRLRGFLQWTENRPVLRTAAFVQLATGRFAADRFSVTAGLRYDRQASEFNALDRPRSDGGHPTERLSYAQASPRLCLLFHGSESFSLKLLLGRAFRTPSPAETFGANTYALASNIRQLQPETTDTLELASDWILSRQFNWRANVFQARMKNLIGYSPANANLSTNLYTLTTRGFETELLWAKGPWSGFLNVSLARRVDETILDPTIAVSREVTWVPSRLANLGVAWKSAGWNASLTLHHQGEARRRSSDSTIASFAEARPSAVPSWNRVDLRLAIRIGKGVELEGGAGNLLDQEGWLPKNFQYPFDYRIDPRTFWVGVRIH